MAEIMKEMIDKEDWERMDKGLPPRKRGRPAKINEPEKPEIAGNIVFKDVPLNDFTGMSARRKIHIGPTGIKFVGFDVTINLKNKEAIVGWMEESELLQLRRNAPKGTVDPTQIGY